MIFGRFFQRSVIFWVRVMDIQNKLVNILLPVHFQTVVSIGSHPISETSSVGVLITGFNESKTSTSFLAPLSFGHVFLVVIVGSVGSKVLKAKNIKNF